MAAELLRKFSEGKAIGDFENDPMLSSAVQRKFEVIGEALKRLSQADPSTTKRVTDAQKIIAFRNILIHGYDEIDDRIVWGILKNKLPTLLREINELMSEETET